MPKQFTLANVHFHWGTKKGSEHTVDGKSYALEMHIVNKNTDGVAVLGFFFEESKVDNKNLEKFLNVAFSLDQKTGLYL